jgi:hypothetical protein
LGFDASGFAAAGFARGAARFGAAVEVGAVVRAGVVFARVVFVAGFAGDEAPALVFLIEATSLSPVLSSVVML